MHRIWKALTGISVIAGLGAITLATARPVQAQEAAKPAAEKKAEKKVKDQAEWDLYDKVAKSTDPNEKLKLLTTWKEKYPDSDFKDDRLAHFIQAYAQTGKFADTVTASKEMLAVDPKNMTAMYWISFLTPALNPSDPSAEAMSSAEKAANGLLAAQMPAGTPPDAWAKAKKDLDALAHKTLGWVAWKQKKLDVAESEFTKSLELNPNQGEVSYWLGTAQLSTQKPDKQATALYHIARAVSIEPAAGGLPSETIRKQIEAYLNKSYVTVHGSDEGLAQMKAAAKASPMPPAGFAIKTAAEIAAEKEEEFKKTNPALALWMGLKKELSGPNGEQFFTSTMKDAHVPGGAGGIDKLKGRLVSAKPAVRPKELVVAVADASTPEVTLRLENPLTGKPVVGSELSFEGVPVQFTKDPFMVTFDQAKVTGVAMEAAAPARKAAPKKKR